HRRYPARRRLRDGADGLAVGGGGHHAGPGGGPGLVDPEGQGGPETWELIPVCACRNKSTCVSGWTRTLSPPASKGAPWQSRSVPTAATCRASPPPFRSWDGIFFATPARGRSSSVPPTLAANRASSS